MTENNIPKLKVFERSYENQNKVDDLKRYAMKLGLRPFDFLVAFNEEMIKHALQDNAYGFVLHLEWEKECGVTYSAYTIQKDTSSSFYKAVAPFNEEDIMMATISFNDD